MAQAMVNFRIDKELKDNMEKVCKEMGLSMTTAFTIFATKVSREKRIPFEITADPFYSAENMERLHKSIAQMEATGGTIHEVIDND
jgi:DNA-damage-inducible protein J